MQYLIRIARAILGFLLMGLGAYITIRANIGYSPYETLYLGVSSATGISYGNVTITLGVIFVAVDLLLREKIGIGTILNPIIIGKFVDLFNYLDFIPFVNDNLLLSIPMLIGGTIVTSTGVYFYMSAELGCGPVDTLMVALKKRLRRLPIGAVKTAMDICYLLIGWLLGAKIGLGTVVAVLCGGIILEYVFKFFRFKPAEVKHESIVYSFGVIFKKKAEQK